MVIERTRIQKVLHTTEERVAASNRMQNNNQRCRITASN